MTHTDNGDVLHQLHIMGSETRVMAGALNRICTDNVEQGVIDGIVTVQRWLEKHSDALDDVLQFVDRSGIAMHHVEKARTALDVAIGKPDSEA